MSDLAAANGAALHAAMLEIFKILLANEVATEEQCAGAMTAVAATIEQLATLSSDHAMLKAMQRSSRPARSRVHGRAAPGSQEFQPRAVQHVELHWTLDNPPRTDALRMEADYEEGVYVAQVGK